MTKKKLTYNKKSRNSISNPHQGMSHSELLNSAKVKLFRGNYEIKNLENGKILVKPKKK